VIVGLGTLFLTSAAASPAGTSARAAGGGVTGWKAILTGPPYGDPRGKGTVMLLTAADTICGQFFVSGIRLPATGAHLIGPYPGRRNVVVALKPPGKSGRSSGCTHVFHALLPYLDEHFSSYVVQIETRGYPRGAIRGRLFYPRMPRRALRKVYGSLSLAESGSLNRESSRTECVGLTLQ